MSQVTLHNKHELEAPETIIREKSQVYLTLLITGCQKQNESGEVTCSYIKHIEVDNTQDLCCISVSVMKVLFRVMFHKFGSDFIYTSDLE